MIPVRIKQIVKSSVVTSVVVALCFLPYDAGASAAFAFTSGWIILNFIVWARIMGTALVPKDAPANPAGLAMGLFAKLVLLGVGLAALFTFAPYTRIQLLAIALGIGAVLLVAVLKTLGSMLVASPDGPAASVNEGVAEKI
jgi:hypothetical protein